jgi:hypothetical protein
MEDVYRQVAQRAAARWCRRGQRLLVERPDQLQPSVKDSDCVPREPRDLKLRWRFEPQHRRELRDVQDRRGDAVDEEARDDRLPGLDPARPTIGRANVHRLEFHVLLAKELLGCLTGRSSRLPEKSGKLGHAANLQQPMAELSTLRLRTARAPKLLGLLPQAGSDLLAGHPEVASTFVSARFEARPGNGSSTSGFALGEHLPAVQDERLAGDVSGFVGDEVADCPADLLGLGQSPERD